MNPYDISYKLPKTNKHPDVIYDIVLNKLVNPS